jgi:hypothetical protein
MFVLKRSTLLARLLFSFVYSVLFETDMIAFLEEC